MWHRDYGRWLLESLQEQVAIQGMMAVVVAVVLVLEVEVEMEMAVVMARLR